MNAGNKGVRSHSRFDILITQGVYPGGDRIYYNLVIVKWDTECYKLLRPPLIRDQGDDGYVSIVLSTPVPSV